jgi:hypothetical protein
LYDLVGDDILFDRLSELAARDPRANAWNDTEVMNRLAELGIEMPEPSVPGNPAEPATAPVAPVAAAPAAPAVPPTPVAEGDGNPDIRPGMKVSQGTVVKVDGNTVTVKTSNGDMMTMNIHDIDQAVAEESSENKYSNLSSRGVNRGINRAGDDFDRMMDQDQVESPHYKTQHQQDTKQRLKTKPMAGPKGHLPEQDMAESAELNTMLKYAGIPVAESRVLDEAGETIDHILNRFKHEVKQFEQGNDLDSDLYEALFDYYSDAGEMPYGVAKARTGDPFSWVSDKLAKHLGVNEGWKGAIAGGLAGGALGSVVPGLGTLAGSAVGAYAGHKLGDQGFKDPDAAYKQAQKLKLKQTPQPPVDEADAISTF